MKTGILIKKNKVISSFKGREKNYVEKAISKIENFFNKKIDFEIIFLNSRKEIDKIYSDFFGKNYKTENWVVGGFFNGDKVYILSKDIFDKESCHPKKDFFPILVHEITHIFIKKIFGFQYPIWLNEGLAYVVANQDKLPLDKKEDLRKIYYEKDWSEKNPYLTSGKFTRFLINTYGKEKVFKLMKSLVSCEEKKYFRKEFKNIFGRDFDSVWNEWFNKP